MTIIKYQSRQGYGVYSYLHHGIGTTRAAHVLRVFGRRKHARKFAKRHQVQHGK